MAQRPLAVFFGTLSLLCVVRIVLGWVSLPIAWVPWTNLALAIAYLALPVFAIYRAASAHWTVGSSLAFFFGGLAVWGACLGLDVAVFHRSGAGSGVAVAIGQAGLTVWCVGLGALLATAIREKNILIPIAVFLAIYDVFLVLSPVGFTAQFMEQAPEVLKAGGASLPAVQDVPATGKASVAGYIGPADFVFLGAYFVALFRFEMRARSTVRWLVPVLALYLLAVLLFEIPLPAMLPIGAVFLVVNWREFRLTRDEKLSTGVVAALGLALVAWGLSRPRPTQGPRAAPLRQEGAPAPRGSEGSPAPVSPGRPPS